MHHSNENLVSDLFDESIVFCLLITEISSTSE